MTDVSLNLRTTYKREKYLGTFSNGTHGFSMNGFDTDYNLDIVVKQAQNTIPLRAGGKN